VQELPLACSLEADELEQRTGRWRQVSRRALIESSLVGGASRLRYRAAEGVEAELRQLVELERVCCAFLEFSLRELDGEIVLEVSGPPQSVKVVAEFAESAGAVSRPS
jgi:hypothetical protein